MKQLKVKKVKLDLSGFTFFKNSEPSAFNSFNLKRAFKALLWRIFKIHKCR